MIRRGMTLVEMLVALTATLVIMAAIAQVFSAFGSAINTSRSVLDLDAQMRSVAWRLRSDLAGVTARMLPPLSPDAGEGYFEVIEGPRSDADAAHGTQLCPADHDDVLLFTTRSMDRPFVAATGTSAASPPAGTLESYVAEVAWFARVTPNTSNPQTFTLYRRQLLVGGYLGSGTFATSNTNSIPFTSWSTFYNITGDISVRRENGLLYPNTLADLTRRESRFMHNVAGTVDGANFPFRFVTHQMPSTDATGMLETLPSGISGLIFDSTSQRQGEDVVLTNVIAFDVRVFDPAALVLLTAGGTPLVPGDPGFSDASIVKTGTASGGYVDLGNGVTSNALLSGLSISPHFGGYGQAQSQLAGSATTQRTYDTWSTHYESNGRDDDKDVPARIDEGTDGLDSDELPSGAKAPDGQIDEPPHDFDGNGVFTDTEDKNGNKVLDPGEDANGNGRMDSDDPGELETSPPYPYPLRGIEVRIRCYEPSSRQVRQVTVRQTFVPQ